MPNTVKIGIMCFLLFLHFGLIYLLYTYKPSKLVAYARPIAELSESNNVTVIEFITRPKAKKTVSTAEAAQAKQNTSSEQVPQKTIAESSATEINKPSSGFDEAKNTQLILSPPAPSYDFNPPPRDLLARPRNTLETQTTRFNKKWKPDGNAIESLKWNSKAVNAVLGLFGGNAKICTDEDRRQRNPECVPDGYKPEE